MHIDTDMGSSDCSTASSASALYATQHQMAPYNAVSNFTLPATSDTLLTPTSISGSPSSRHLPYLNPQQQQQQQHQHQQYNRKGHFTLPTVSGKTDNPAKPLLLNHSPPMSHTAHHHYSQPQQLTPPATSSSMHYPYDNVSEATAIGQTSSTSSYDLNSYPYQSPKEDGLPTTMDGYPFNSYTATAPPTEDNTNSPSMYSFSGAMNGHTGYMGQGQRLPPPNPVAYSQYASPSQGPHHQHHPQGLAPLLSQPRPNTYRPARPVANEYTGAPTIPPLSMAQNNPDGSAYLHNRRLPPTAASSDHSRTPRTQAGSLSDMNMLHTNVANSTGQSNAGSNGSPMSIHDAIPAELANWVITEGPELELNEKASEDDRFLFDIHKQLKGHRGKGMWENITQQFRESYPDSKHTTARLQMKYTRAVRRHARWPKEAYDAMLKIYAHEEKHKYARYCSLLKESGGNKYWDWKPADVEAFVVRMGLEDPTPDVNSKLRRRNQNQMRKFQQKSEQVQQAPGSTMPPAWSNGYAPAGHQQFPLPNPQQAHPMAVEAYDYAQSAAIPTPIFSDEQQVALMEQLEEKYTSDGADEVPTSNNSNSPTDHAMSNGASDASGSAYSRPLPSPSSGMGSTSQYGRSAPRLKSEYK